jgi:hypothetical protein
MRLSGTPQLLNCSKIDSINKWIYWDEFLGNSDVNNEHESTPHFDDRIFSTAVAINALIDTWTQKINSTIIWLVDTPEKVKSTCEQATNFLNNFILTDTYQLDNAFFSGSVKSTTTLPPYYPNNELIYMNGTKLDQFIATFDDIDRTLSLAMKGVVSEAEYEEMINKRPFNQTTPQSFPGFDVDGFGMPFWSSSVLTQSMTALALGKIGILLHQ